MKTIYNICPYVAYRNEQLMKDTCLIPYMFHQRFGYEAVIVTAKREEFSYLKLLPGLRIDVQEDTDDINKWTDWCKEYIMKKHDEIDILFCFGSRAIYAELVPLYKSLNANGKVILKLDANSGWIDRIPAENEQFCRLYGGCDLITCESKRVKKLISEK